MLRHIKLFPNNELHTKLVFSLFKRLRFEYKLESHKIF